MNWIRSRTRFGARLALFALTVQLALSFGHVHFDGFAPAWAQPVPATAAAGVVPSQSAPTNKSDGLIDDYCPLCALIQLAATASPSVAPVLPLPIHFGPTEHAAPVQIALAASPHVLFQARAPPALLPL
jgi:hypothetical protein